MGQGGQSPLELVEESSAVTEPGELVGHRHVLARLIESPLLAQRRGHASGHRQQRGPGKREGQSCSGIRCCPAPKSRSSPPRKGQIGFQRMHHHDAIGLPASLLDQMVRGRSTSGPSPVASKGPSAKRRVRVSQSPESWRPRPSEVRQDARRPAKRLSARHTSRGEPSLHPNRNPGCADGFDDRRGHDRGIARAGRISQRNADAFSTDSSVVSGRSVSAKGYVQSGLLQ